MTTVIGLDLSLTSTGVALVHNGVLDRQQVFSIKTTGKKGDNLAKRASRLNNIAHQLTTFLSDDYVDLVVIESPSFGSQHGSAHDRSGLWWLVVNHLWTAEVPVAMVSPQGRAKWATGKGNSKKPEVYAAAKARYGEIFKCDDEADATLLAGIGTWHLGKRLAEDNFAIALDMANAFDLRTKFEEVLKGVHWPDVTEWEAAA